MIKLETTFIYGLFDPLEPETIRYVGKTNNNPRIRLWQHISDSKNSHSYKSNWIKKLIFEGRKPKIKVLKEVKMSEWMFWEKFYVKKFKNNKLTNATEGGDGGISNEEYEKLSLQKWKKVVQIDFKTHKIINTFLNISEAANYNKIKSHSRISDCCNGKIHTSMGYVWRFLDEAGNIIEVKKIRKSLLSAKRVAQIDINTNKIIDIYNSITNAANKYNISIGNICKCCFGKNRSAIGYIWRYLDDKDEIIQPKLYRKPKQVAMLDSNSNIIKTCINSAQASKHVGLKSGDSIMKCCKNSKYSAGGYKWKFYDINSENGIL